MSIPEIVTVNVPLTLTAAVVPVNATNQTIIWSVNSGDAVIDRNVLTANKAGSITVTALINNGAVQGGDFVRRFPITAVDEAVNTNEITVTSGANDGAGSLRQAISSAASSGATIVIDPSVKTIALTSYLSIGGNLVIEGNGVTLTRSPSWTAIGYLTRLLSVYTLAEVTIRRVHFKDGRVDGNGAAISNGGKVTLESCIFSGNRAASDSIVCFGGAINNTGTLDVRGCTFYNNSVQGSGGAIYNASFSNATLSMSGNLFYGNTASDFPILCSSGTITSGGYNVVDIALGDENNQSGWAALAGDKQITNLPLSPDSFKPLSQSGALGVITALPEHYPAVDFYGNPISANGAAGAVQVVASETIADFIDAQVNDNVRGSVSVTPPSGLDAPASVTAEPLEGCVFGYWLLNEENLGSANPLEMNVTNLDVTVQAVFRKVFTVTDVSDSGGAGTLRHVLTTVPDDEIVIRFVGVEPMGSTVALTGELPPITKNIVIEGNGVIITRSPSWIAVSEASQLLTIGSSATVTISRVYFKDGHVTRFGGAVRNDGKATLESCIFSGNRAASDGIIGSGGALYNTSVLDIRGCTFYNNSSRNSGGAISQSGGTITLTGNLFYGNTASNSPIVSSGSGTVMSRGYNVVDVGFGIALDQSGWYARDTDKSIKIPSVSSVSFKLLSGSVAAGVITEPPDGYPAVDFYGNPIRAAGAAGAVQAMVSGGNFFLEAQVSDSARGSISITPPPDDEGLYPGSVSVEAIIPDGDCELAYWLVNGERGGVANPLVLTLTGHDTVLRAVFRKTFTVDTSNADGGVAVAGTLRHALANVQDEDIISFTGVEPLSLTGALPEITKRITIEGNGITITRSPSWTAATNVPQQLLRVGSSAEVTIRRVHFKDGRAPDNGGAVSNGGSLTLESCIFSGNRAGDSIVSSSGVLIGTSSYGGAVSNSGTLNINGCTFYNNTAYNNTASSGGSAIHQSGGTLTLTGNLFRGNFTSDVSGTGGTVTSLGFNVTGTALGTGTGQSGWSAAASDRQITAPPMSVVSFRLTSGSGAAGIITDLPEGYPTDDFYGNPITAPASAGAVQGTVGDTGFVVDVQFNKVRGDTFTVTSASAADGLVSGSVSVTVTPNDGFTPVYWLVNPGMPEEYKVLEYPLELNVTGNTVVEAVFGWAVSVTNGDPSPPIPGSLRYAITNARSGDIIRFTNISTAPVEVARDLPEITRNITIEGNGRILQRSNVSVWPSGPTTQLLRIGSSVTVTISRLHFRNGYASYRGGAIHNDGNLILESCIFSNNQVVPNNSSDSVQGGAIYINNGSVDVKGCTFYGNHARNTGSSGGAIYRRSGTLYLTGNIFSGNTTNSTLNAVVNSVTSSRGYNVSNVDFGSGASGGTGWSNSGTDKWELSPLSNTTTTFAPSPALSTFIPYPRPEVLEDFPETDFNGNTRTFPGAPGAVK